MTINFIYVNLPVKQFTNLNFIHNLFTWLATKSKILTFFVRLLISEKHYGRKEFSVEFLMERCNATLIQQHQIRQFLAINHNFH